ncbi:hypothetical protein [Trichloromonas sp.]|uniref:hypothetical protein n=1 Tax=Trichloromonas sp. TaxID=3069249 RepID=UPI002A4AF348|nr:hypothetical protein [Trichloromonas sp.]
MKRTLSTLIITAASASTAFASGAAEGSGFGLVTIAFLGFFAVIIATQLLPGLTLFISGAKSIFGKGNKEAGSHR